MGKRNRKRTGPIRNFTMIPNDLFKSLAYKKLPKAAGKALLIFRAKPMVPYSAVEYHHVDFPFSNAEGVKYGFAKGTFSRIICDLVAYGFIDPSYKGGLRGDRKTTNRFKISSRWEKYGQPGFEEISWKQYINNPNN